MHKILFVYNAKSGKLNALIDAGHKLLSPGTYPCDLCALTYSTFSENKKWKAFRTSVQLDMEFHHSDEFEALFPQHNFKYPVVIHQYDSSLKTLLSKEELKKIKTVDELIRHITTAVNYLK